LLLAPSSGFSAATNQKGCEGLGLPDFERAFAGEFKRRGETRGERGAPELGLVEEFDQ
jgi:hypothetical protein